MDEVVHEVIALRLTPCAGDDGVVPISDVECAGVEGLEFEEEVVEVGWEGGFLDACVALSFQLFGRSHVTGTDLEK